MARSALAAWRVRSGPPAIATWPAARARGWTCRSRVQLEAAALYERWDGKGMPETGAPDPLAVR